MRGPVPCQGLAQIPSLTPHSDSEPDEPALDTHRGQKGREIQIQVCLSPGPKSLATALP